MATSAPSIFPALAQLDIGDVLAHMPGGFFVYRADGDEAVVYANEACLRIFGSGSFLIPSMVCILVALLLLRRPIEAKESEAAK